MKVKYVFLCLIACLFVSCSADNAVSSVVNFFDMKDCQAPELLEVCCTSASTVSLVFDEEVFPVESSFSSMDVSSCGEIMTVELPFEISPASCYDLSGRVKDKAGNSTYFSARIWGFNENPAQAVINEFSTKGSSTQSDRTELLITRGGNTAGLTLYDGVPGDSKKSVVLPYREVRAGDFVVIYWTETLPSSAVQSDSVFSVCAQCESSLSDDNGILTLSSSPGQGSEVLDCVIYCSFESSQYEGFGTKAVLNRVNRALEENWWFGSAVDSSKSTSTRSICRRPGYADSDTADEWYTVVTRGLTFGESNTAEAYSP